MGDSKLYFVMGAFAFILFVTQIGEIIGLDMIPNAPTTPQAPTSIIDTIFTNFGYFFQLMGLSSAYALVGFVLAVISIGMIWAIIELIRGV